MDLPGDDEPGFRAAPGVTVVTGGTGWLGAALVPVLRGRGGEVRVFDGDVRDPAALDRLFDGAGGCSVVHAAAVIHPEGRTRDFFDVNVGGTGLVLDRARRAGACRFVHVSSNSPFGANPTTEHVFDESSAFSPYMGYGRSKMEAEQLVARAAAAGHVETVVLRPPWFYGPGQPPRQSRFFAMVRRGLFPRCGDGRNRRSLVYVDDLAQAIVRAERREGLAGRAYWIADREPYAMDDILDAVRAALRDAGLDVRPQRVRLPGLVARAAEVADGLLQGAGRYSQQLHVLSEMDRTIACSIAAAEADLGFRPSVGLVEGMRRSVRWCLEQGHEL